MDADRTHDDSDISSEPTVASVLGLSGPIRFRLHGSTQKAHLLLKPSEEKRPLDGISGTHGVAYYSLFAQKRIEVKPGKEILLALEGKFGDRPILICGDISSSSHEPMKPSPPTTTVEAVATKLESTKPSRTASPMPVREAAPNLPPKLRKAWMKSMQNRQPVEPPKPETREMAVQTEVEYTSTGVDPLTPQYASIAVGSPILKYSHVDVGTTPISEPMSLASSPQEPATIQQTMGSEPPRLPSLPPTSSVAVTEPSTSEPRQRSLSPMEMSSTPSSPVQPPTKQSQLPKSPPSYDLHSDKKKVDTPVSPPPRASHTTESPHPTWGVSALGPGNASWDITRTPRAKSPVSSTASSRGNASPTQIPGLVEPILPQISTSEATLVGEPEPTKNEAATPVLPRSPVSSRDGPLTSTPLRDTKQEEQSQRIPSQGASSDRSRSPSVKQHEPLSWDRPEPSNRPYRDPFPPRGKHQDRTQRPVTTPNNAQYRGMFEEGGSRNYGWNNTSTSATDSWGVTASYDAPPELEGYRTRGRPNGRGLSDQGEKSKAASRPELRSLVTLSSGPLDNPLGIRPASPPRKIRIPPRSALQRGKDETKKGVVIGTDWPKNKSNGGGSLPPRYSPDPPSMNHPPQRRPSGMLNGKPPPNFVHGHTIKATIQDAPNGPTTPPRGVKRRLSTGQETPRIESWTPVHAAAVPGSNVRMGMISFSPSGRYFAVSCNDRSVRIWDTHTYAELAKLAHVQSVISVAWMENDSGVVSLGEIGEINRWTKLPTGEWAWARMLDASGEFKPGDRPTCFAYMKDRIAVAYPQMGVKVWLWVNGMWQQQRSILRHHVTNIRFVEGGRAIFGGTSDSVLWYCQVPSGTLRACLHFPGGIDYIDVSPSETELLVSLTDNTASIVSISGSSPEIGAKLNLNAINAGVPGVHGGIYLNQGNSVLYGDTRERMFKWGLNGMVVAELMKAIGVQDQYRIEAVANYSFPDGHPCAGCIVMGTASGDLLWWRYHSNGEFERSTAWYKRSRYD